MGLTLARLRLQLLVKSVRDPATRGKVLLVVVVEFIAAAATCYIGGADAPLFPVAMAGWATVWLVGPILFGLSASELRFELLGTLGRAPGTLTRALTIEALVGPGAVATLIALMGGVVAAANNGPSVTVVAAAAVLPELLILVLGSRVTLLAISRLFGTRAGAAASGAAAAMVLAIGAQVWVIAVAIGQHRSAATLGQWARLIPSGWVSGLTEAVTAGNYGEAAGFAIALLGAPALLFGAFQLLVDGAGRAARPTFIIRRPLTARTRAAAALAKEFRSWTRDPFRSYVLGFSIAYAITFCALPLAIDLRFFLAAVPALFLMMLTALSANSYGADGSALWLIVMTPGSARVDVRARQIALLTFATPVAVLLLVPVLVSADLRQLLPEVAATLLALIGCGAGLAILTSIVAVNPLTDPHRRGADALNLGGDMVRALLVVLGILVVMSVVVVPVFFVTLESPIGGVLLGAGVGALAWFGFRILAGFVLSHRAADLLQRMLAHNDALPETAVEETAVEETAVEQPLSRRESIIAGVCWALAWLPTFAQGLAPAIVLATHGNAAPWLFAAHLPPGARWPIIAATIAVGLILYAIGITIPVRHRLLVRGARSAVATRS